jgi:hypothetical protein
MSAPATEQTLERIRSLSRDFRAAAEKRDLVAMDELLSERRALLETLPRLPDRGPATPDEQRRRERLLRSILTLDREAEHLLAHVRDEWTADLVAVGAGKRGLTGYGGGRRRSGKWIDERG